MRALEETTNYKSGSLTHTDSLKKQVTRLAASLAVHALLLGFFTLYSYYQNGSNHQKIAEQSKTSQPMMIELDRSTNKEKNTQIVQTKLVEKSKEAAKNAKWGEQTQTVSIEKSKKIFNAAEIEKKISLSNLKNTASNPQTPSTQKTTNPQSNQKNIAQKSNFKAQGSLAHLGVAMPMAASEVSHQPIQAPNAQRNQNQAQTRPIARNLDQYTPQAQAKGDYVKGLNQDSESLLNTKEFVFYGYFKRIRDQLQQTWGANLREYIRHEFKKAAHTGGRALASFEGKSFETQVLVTLNEKGIITKVELLGASGSVQIDDVAVKSLNDANQFPNPPKAIIDDNKEVTIKWDFLLHS